MKRILAAVMCALMVLTMFAGCAQEQATTTPPAESKIEAPASDVAMQYKTVDEAEALLNDSSYVFFDVRKAADSSAASIPGALAYDMDAAKALRDDSYVFFDVRKAEDSEKATIPGAAAHDMDAAKGGDFAHGIATMQLATRNLDKNIVIICYSGKAYAQATTNALAALGYDMSKVYTLEGGFNAWSEAFKDDVAMNYIAPADALAVLEDDSYIFFDVRKAADYATAHIPGAVSYDMDAAKEGDFNAGLATMMEATKDLDKNIVVICYSGKRYAQATTNALSALGYDMSKVFTLEGGFTAWSDAGYATEA